jgi:hypothetical protein
VSAPREHPIKRLGELAQESAILLWKSYDLHMSHDVRDSVWHENARVLFERCLAADARVWRLIELQEKWTGRERADDANDAPQERSQCIE